MILIGTDAGIYRWFDGNPWPIYHSLQGRSIAALASPGGGVIAAVDGAGRILESVNNGIDWREIALPEGSGRPTAVAVAGAPATMVVATRGQALYARAIGAPMRTKLAPVEAARRFGTVMVGQVRTIAARRKNGAAVLTPQGQIRTTADLKGWTLLQFPASGAANSSAAVRALAADPIVPSTWYAATAGAGLWASTDGIKTWSRLAGLPDEVYAIRVASGPEGGVFAATSDGCRVSRDAGATWVDAASGLEAARHVRAVEVKPGEPDVLLAGAAPKPLAEGVAPRDGLRFALYESADGAKTWSHVLRGFPEVLEYDAIADIRFDPASPKNILVALGSGEIHVSRNNGEYWAPLARQIKAARVLCATI